MTTRVQKERRNAQEDMDTFEAMIADPTYDPGEDDDPQGNTIISAETYPAAPVLSARNIGDFRVQLKWKPIDGADTYRVYRGVGGGLYAIAAGHLGNEVDQLIISEDVASGTFTLTFGAQTTANIAFDATAAAVLAALEALSTVDPGDIIVTKDDGGVLNLSSTNPRYWIEFVGPKARTNVGAVTMSTANLVGDPTKGSVGTYLAGGAYASGIEAVTYIDSSPSHNLINYYEVYALDADDVFGPASNLVSVLVVEAVDMSTPTAGLRHSGRT